MAYVITEPCIDCGACEGGDIFQALSARLIGWTTLACVSFIILMDFFVVDLLIEHSLAIFASPLGTWLPFALFCTSTFTVGRFAAQHQARTGSGSAVAQRSR